MKFYIVRNADTKYFLVRGNNFREVRQNVGDRKHIRVLADDDDLVNMLGADPESDIMQIAFHAAYKYSPKNLGELLTVLNKISNDATRALGALGRGTNEAMAKNCRHVWTENEAGFVACKNCGTADSVSKIAWSMIANRTKTGRKDGDRETYDFVRQRLRLAHSDRMYAACINMANRIQPLS